MVSHTESTNQPTPPLVQQWACSARKHRAKRHYQHHPHCQFSGFIGISANWCSLLSWMTQESVDGWTYLKQPLRVKGRPLQDQCPKSRPSSVPINALPTVLSHTNTEPKKARGACGGLNGSTLTECELVVTCYLDHVLTRHSIGQEMICNN